MRTPSSLKLSVAVCLCALAGIVSPAAAQAQTGGASPSDSSGRTPSLATPGGTGSGGTDPGATEPGSTIPSGPVGQAQIVGGQAVPPSGAPPQVVAAIAAANEIANRPYRWGGGHGSFVDTAYDCSGAVSYALRGAGVLTRPLASGPLMRWGQPGPGQWITVYTNRGHAFIVIAGLRFDTGYRNGNPRILGTVPGRGPRWGGLRASAGFVARHPAGL